MPDILLDAKIAEIMTNLSPDDCECLAYLAACLTWDGPHSDVLRAYAHWIADVPVSLEVPHG